MHKNTNFIPAKYYGRRGIILIPRESSYDVCILRNSANKWQVRRQGGKFSKTFAFARMPQWLVANITMLDLIGVGIWTEGLGIKNDDDPSRYVICGEDTTK